MPSSRLLLLLVLAGAFSGCASLKAAFTDLPSEAAIVVPKTTPEQAYNAGVIFQERGDFDAARREWDRCLAMSSPESPSRVDCLVALEKTASSSTTMEQ